MNVQFDFLFLSDTEETHPALVARNSYRIFLVVQYVLWLRANREPMKSNIVVHKQTIFLTLFIKTIWSPITPHSSNARKFFNPLVVVCFSTELI